MVNKGSHFADFVRFCPHIYMSTQQSLPPLRQKVYLLKYKNRVLKNMLPEKF